MQFALPAREARAVERFALGCVLVALAAGTSESLRSVARYFDPHVPDELLPIWASLACLALVGLAFVLLSGLLLTGSLPAGRRLSVGGTIVLALAAVLLTPIPMYALPAAWHSETLFKLMETLPLTLAFLALLLLCQGRDRVFGAAALVAIIIHEAMAWLAFDAMYRGPLPREPMMLFAFSSLTLLAGFALSGIWIGSRVMWPNAVR